MDIWPLLAAIDALLSALLSATLLMLPSPSAAKLTPPTALGALEPRSLERGSSFLHGMRRGIDMNVGRVLTRGMVAPTAGRSERFTRVTPG